MAIESSRHDGGSRKLRLGMVGGGHGAFIGAVHRMAARLDDRYELVAGALSANPENARRSALDLGIAEDRAYTSYEEMAEKEAAREDGIDVVSIVTPNHLHFAPAKAFLEAGIHVICDKPMTVSLEEAKALVALVRKTGLVFVLTQNYTGYPMVRHAREMVASGALGDIRVLQTNYAQDWLATAIDQEGQKQAAWRTDPKFAGAGGSVGDIGVHAFNLAAFVSGLEIEQLCADLRSTVPGRQLDDNANVLMRFKGGATGTLWVSQVATGNFNRLTLGVYGTKGGIQWDGEDNDNLLYTPLGEATRILTRGGPDVGAAAGRSTRLPTRHPEGFIEGFTNVYTDAAELIAAKRDGRAPDPGATSVPTVEDGARGLAFIEACVKSSRAGGVWVDASIDL
ncbi:Gfo/Idh/MocA family protein [Acuticoccus kandeliae]|uniref:Gfo/Idh/MocA family protein n=1 Tax=Acuticoccus kandeliae TaxID=2073160 RepID=UPI000D3E89BB|nr:Gfo/Idh/MocA family oxidoreductase [Acuticoccus kandeliae]